MIRILEFHIAEEGYTIEAYLRKKAFFTKKQISQAKFRSGGFRVNGQQQRSTHPLHPCDKLTVCLEEEEKGSHHLVGCNEIPLQIIYEDADILVLYKPAGIVCHPTGNYYEKTLANAVVQYYRKQGMEVTARFIGRLDREVSGLVLFAKNQTAAARLWKQREQGILQKEYVAEVEGSLSEASMEITSPILQNSSKNREMAEKTANTHLTVLERRSDTTLLKVLIHTGRTHQIRIHLDSIGHPIVNDIQHGAASGKKADIQKENEKFCQIELSDSSEFIEGIHLHAGKIKFLHPITGAPLQFTAAASWE